MCWNDKLNLIQTTSRNVLLHDRFETSVGVSWLQNQLQATPALKLHYHLTVPQMGAELSKAVKSDLEHSTLRDLLSTNEVSLFLHEALIMSNGCSVS